MISLVLDALWYRRSLTSLVLLPLSWLYQIIVQLRILYFRFNRPADYRAPVIIVGNLSVGGTGKTPLVAALAAFLREQGYRPGIVMRGYQSHFKGATMAVLPSSSPWEAGEESVLLAQKTGCPVTIGKHRAEAVKALLSSHPEVDVILSDDGLSHYAMARSFEIAVVDGQRGLGNGFCLPAGPLREPRRRLKSVDYTLSVDKQLSDTLYAIDRPDQQISLSDFTGKTVHAVAGIGNPNLFFAQLKAKGINIIPHAFPDHHWYTLKDISFNDDYPIIMTEKDAIKCVKLQHQQPLWCVPLSISIPISLKDNLLRSLQQWTKNSSTSWPAPSASNL